MPIAHVLALYLVTAQVLCNEHGSLEHEIPRRSFLSRRAIDGTRGRKYFDPEDTEGAFDSYGSAGGQYDPYEEKTDLSDIRKNVPGEPGLDYPAYTTLPQTGFTCEGRSRGYYADEDAGCQVFHVCHDVLVSSFLCPIGSTFSQKLLTCDWWTKVDCSTTRKFIEVNRNSYQVDDDEMIRNAYAMITLQSGKDLTRDGLVDPDRSGRVFDFVPIDTTGNDVPNEYEDYNGVQHYSTHYDDYRNRYKTKTSPSYQNNFHSPPPQNHLRGSSRYQDSQIIRIHKYGEPHTKDVSRTSFNQFQPSYAPTVPTVTTTTRRFYSPTVPTTFRPSTVSYNKLDLTFESSDHLYSHSKEDRDHVTPPTFAYKSGRDEGRSREIMREEDFYDEDEKTAESVERQTYVLSNSTRKDDSSFETEDFETRESIGLARALGGAQKNKLLERSRTEKPKNFVNAWTGVPILANSGSSENSEESTKSPEKADVHNTTRTANDKVESEESSDFYDPDIGGTTTASYESQEIASTQQQTFETKETTLRPTTINKPTVHEKYFNVKNESEILEESSTNHYHSPREELVEVESRQSISDKKEISSRIDSQPLEFLREAQSRFRISIPDRVSPQTPNPNRFSTTTDTYPTTETTETPNLTTIKSGTNFRNDESTKGNSNSEDEQNSEQLSPTSIKGPRFHSTIRIGVHQADSHRNSKEFSPIGSLHYDYEPKKETSRDHAENERIVRNRGSPLSRDFIVDLPISDIVPPIVDYNDGYDDFLAPNEEIPIIEEKQEVKNNSEIELLSKYNPDLKFTIRGADVENERKEEKDGILTTTPKPQILTRPFDEHEKAYAGKIIPLREAIQKFISAESDDVFTSTPSSDISKSTQSGILNPSPFGENFGTTPSSNAFNEEILSRRNFDTSGSNLNGPSTISPADFSRSVSTSINANDDFGTQGPSTLRPFKSQDNVGSFIDFEYNSQNPVTSRQFNGQDITELVKNYKLNSENPVTLPPFNSQGTVGLFKDSEFTTRNSFQETDVRNRFSNFGLRSDKNAFDTSVLRQNPTNQDQDERTVNPVQFINDHISANNENNQGHIRSFNNPNNSAELSKNQNLNNNYNHNVGFSTTSRTISDLLSNFNREFIESTVPTTSKTFDTFRNTAENYPTARTLASDIKDANTGTENSRKSAVTQRSVVQSKKENNFETESSTPNNLFRSFKLESLKDIEDTIEQSKSPYQVSLTVNKDEDPGDDFIARLIAQHTNRNFSNERIDDFEIIRSVDPDVLSGNTGSHDQNQNHDHSNSNFDLKNGQNNFGHNNNNNYYSTSNTDDRINNDRFNFNSSAVNYNLRNDSSVNNHRESSSEVNFDGRANGNLNNGTSNLGNYNNHHSGTNYHARLSDHGREYNYTVSVTNSTSVKIGDHPQEFKRDSKLNSLSLLQLMAELLKIDRLPRPFTLQDPGTIEVRARSESNPEIIDLRTKSIPSSENSDFNTRLELNPEFNLRTRLESVPESSFRTRLESIPESGFRTRLESIPESNLRTRLESNPEINFRTMQESKPEFSLRTKSESGPEIDLRTKLFLSSESLATSERPLTKNLESLDLLSGINIPNRSSSKWDNTEQRPRSTQSTILDSILSQNQNSQLRSNLEAVEVHSRGNSNLNDVPTTTHKSILISSNTDQSNKNDSKLKESLETSASRNVRPLKKEHILEQLAENFGEPIYKIGRRPIFDLPNVNRDVDFRTGFPIDQENAKHSRFEDSSRIRPQNSDLEDASVESLSIEERLKFSKFGDSLRLKPLSTNSKDANVGRIPNFGDFGGENFGSDFKVTPSKAIDFTFKDSSPSSFRHSTIASTFQITSPNPVRQFTDSNSEFSVTNFDSVKKSKLKSKDAEFEEYLKVTPRVTTETPRLTTTSTTTTESSKTIVETEFVPSIGFSFDTDEGREEYVEAVLGGLIHGPRKGNGGESPEVGAKNDTKRV